MDHQKAQNQVFCTRTDGLIVARDGIQHHLTGTEAQCNAPNHWTKVRSKARNDIRECLYPKWISET
jgi:hypothetical protein